MRSARLLILMIGLLLLTTASTAVAAQVTGVVSALPGTGPVGGVAVTVRDHTTTAIVAGATTDVAGNYAVTVPNGDYDFTFQPPPLSGFHTTTGPTVHVSGDRTFSIGMTKEGVFRFAGVVRDADGHPLPSVSVTLKSSSTSATTQSASDGSYALAVTAGNYSVALSSNTGNGYSVPNSFYTNNSTQTLAITGDRDQDITLPAHNVTINVTGPDGRPIAGTSI
ncbi:carboxypeptidase-like regulatory domain-containing protein, partial [Conexibacter woesei]|uniref:carboxypeptidase-like regulatory domain-containing protein n=1 Tax=Conexibacter woesei TaxID=191495 RepID=UPI00047C68AB